MSIETTIKGIISKLSPEWFTSIKKEFELNPFYNKATGVIDIGIEEDEYSWDLDTAEEAGSKRTILIQCSLPEYSWKGIPISLSNENDQPQSIFKAKMLSKEIVDSINVLLKEFTDLEAKDQLIVSTVKYMEEEASSLKIKFDDKYYHDILDYCIKQFRFLLSWQYGDIKKAHDTIPEFKDGLFFDLSLKELAFLLAVLIRAEFIQGSKENGETFVHFFSKYFYFKNQKKGNSFDRAQYIQKRISDAMSYVDGDYMKIKADIKKKLIEAIDSL